MRYDPTEGVYGWAATCPYCGAVGDYATLSDAVRSGVKHSKVCHAAT